MTAGTTTLPVTKPTEAAVAAPATAEPPLLDHEYDGIQEFDNPLPGWWKLAFYATIVFAVGYWIWFHAGGPGQSEIAQYVIARQAYDEQRAADEAAAGTVDEATLAGRARDPQAVQRGREVFTKYCVSCHTDNGRGLVGPNLTDDFQKHGHTRVDVFATVRGGVPATAMIAWAEMLKPEQLLDVVAFVTTLRGTNVPGGKAPEGERVGPFAP